MATILLVGSIHNGGEINWRLAPPPIQEEAPKDGDLQRLIDYGEETAEYEDWLIDQEWIRGGC